MWMLMYFIILGFEPHSWTHDVYFGTEEECITYVEENFEIKDFVDYISAVCIYNEQLGKGV